jgi:hypothetical protein
MRCFACEIDDLADVCVRPDEDMLDLIEQAFLDARIDGETLSLAFAWVESNDIQIH